MSPPDAVIHGAIRQLNVAARRHGADGEDLVQEALTRAVANGVPLSAIPWLQTVTKRLAIDRARRSRELASGGAIDLEKFFTEVGSGPEEEVLGEERRSQVRAALNALPERHRSALLAWAEEGPTAVSRRLGTSPGATWTLLSRAREKLRKELDKIGVVPGVFGLRMRLGSWWNLLAPAGVTLGVALSIAVPSPQPAARGPMPSVERPVVVTAAVGAPANLHALDEPESRIGNPGRSTRAQLSAATPVQPPVPETHMRARVGTCVATHDEEDQASVRVDIIEDGRRTPGVRPVLQKLPEPLKDVDNGGCENQ